MPPHPGLILTPAPACWSGRGLWSDERETPPIFRDFTGPTVKITVRDND